MNVRSRERFNGFWVSLFSLMVGYLLYFFIGETVSNKIVPNSRFESLIALFFMTSCMVLIYISLSFLLERKLPKFFIYVLWAHYFILFFIINFAINKGVSGFRLNPFNKLSFSGLEYVFILIKNIALFLPIGYLLRKENVLKSFAFVVLLVLTIELSQYALKSGYFDVNDIIFSIIGVYVGYFSFRKPRKRREKRE